MEIILPKEKTVLVEFNYKELSLLTRGELHSQNSCESFIKSCHENNYIPISDWIENFKNANKERDNKLVSDIKSLLNFYENRIDALDRFYKFVAEGERK